MSENQDVSSDPQSTTLPLSDGEAVRALLTRAEVTLDHLRDRLDAHDARMAEHEQRMKDLVISVGAHVDRLEAEVVQTLHRFNAEQNAVIELQKRVQVDVASVAQAVAHIEESSKSRIDNLARRIEHAETVARAVDSTMRDGFKSRDEELRKLRETAAENRNSVRALTSQFPDIPDPDEITKVRHMPTLPNIEARLADVLVKQAEAKLEADQSALERARRNSDRAHARHAQLWRIARKALTHVVVPVAVAVGLAAAVVASAKVKSCGGVSAETKEQKR